MIKKPLFNDLSKDEKKSFFKNFFEKTSSIQDIFKSDRVNLLESNYTNKFRCYFTKIIRQRLNSKIDKIENIHHFVGDDYKKYDYDYGINAITSKLYDLDNEFYDLYHNFLKDWCSSSLFRNKKFYFQKTPTIRVHCPGSNSKSVYPAYHNDIFLGHHPMELNLWIPLTLRGEEGHGFSILTVQKSKEILNKYDFDIFSYYNDVRNFSNPIYKYTHDNSENVDTEFGEILLFDVRSIHSTLPMKNQTRVSMDIRIIFADDKEAHQYAHVGLGRMRSMFEVGDYYFENAIG